MRPHHEKLPDDLQTVARLLREQRATATPLELDQIKQQAKSRALRRVAKPMLRTRLVTGLLVLGLVGSGGAAVIAQGGGGGGGAPSANSQYCPPGSPGAGKPKVGRGGNKCGLPPAARKGGSR